VKRVRALLAEWLSPRLIKKLWLGFETEEDQGLLKVAGVDEDGPAKSAGLQEGDVLRAVNMKPVGNLFDFNRALLPLGPGDEVLLDVDRQGRMAPVVVTLEPVPKPSGERLALRLLGLRLTQPEAGSRHGRLKFRKGLFISEVVEGGPAEAAGLRPGLLVTRIGDFDIGTLDEVGLALENVRHGEWVPLSVVSVMESETLILAQSSTVRVRAD
jgi:serine protease Do